VRFFASRRWIIFLLCSGTFINAVDRASLSTAAPILSRDLRLDSRLTGIALSAFFWLYLVGNIPAGRLADIFGAKRVLGWAATLWSVCSALTGCVGSYFGLILTRVGVGVGESASFPCNAKVVNTNFPPERRGLVVAFYTAGLRLGLAVTPLFMAHLIHFRDWRFAFYVTGIGSLAWAALWAATFRDSTPSNEGLNRRVSLNEVLRQRTSCGLFLCKFFQDYLFYLFVTWMPGYLVSSRGFTVMQMGWYASLPWMVGCLAQPLAGAYSDWLIRRGRSVTFARKSVIVSMQLMAASIIGAGYATNATVAEGLLILSVACESAAMSILWTACTDVAPPQASGSLAGVMNSAGALAGILAPIATGFLVKASGGFQLPLLLGGGMVVLAAASILFVVRDLNPLELPITYRNARQ
jgi:ACS family glucarate transporter-like MFS transporter